MSLEEEARGVAPLRALAHPLRLRMLSLLTGATMSAAELGRELGVSHALASYHLRQLADAGLVVLAEERSRRGGRERRYRMAPVDTRWRPPLPDDEGHALMLEAIIDELRRRRAARHPQEPGLTVDAELWVSREEWERARDAIAAATRRLHEVARPPHLAGTVRVAVTAMLFRMADDDPPAAGPVRRPPDGNPGEPRP